MLFFAQKEAKNAAEKCDKNGKALAAQPNDLAHNRQAPECRIIFKTKD